MRVNPRRASVVALAVLALMVTGTRQATAQGYEEYPRSGERAIERGEQHVGQHVDQQVAPAYLVVHPDEEANAAVEPVCCSYDACQGEGYQGYNEYDRYGDFHRYD